MEADDESGEDDIEDEEEAIAEIMRSKKELKELSGSKFSKEIDMIEKILAKETGKDVKKEKKKASNILAEPVKKEKDENIDDEEASLKEYESYDSDKEIAAYDELNDDLNQLTE
jgi:hypothetical protein